MRILITDSDSRSALAAVRSLGRAGHEVFVGGERRDSLAAASRHARDFVAYPSPARDPDGFVAAVAAAARTHRIDILMPMTEITTLLLTQRRADLPESARLPFPSVEVVTRANDKAAVLELAAAHGVPIPRTHVIADPAKLPASLDLGWPVVIKPTRSRVPGKNGFINTGVQYANDAAELADALARLPAEVFPVLLQERIVGPGVGLFACCDHGRPIARFAHQRLREKPPAGGVSVLRESAPLDPVAREHADRLLGALGWHGVAMVEFKRDLRDGSLRLMEINGRFWGSLQLAIDAGVDFPALLARLAAGEQPPPQTDYALGVRSRWFWGDVDALLLLLTRSRAKLGLPPDHPGRWRTLASFMAFWRRRQRDEVMRLDDLGPWFLETRHWLFGR